MKVRTAHYTYDVLFEPKGSPAWSDAPAGVEPTDSGYTDHDHELIVIRDDLRTSMKADTLLHEMLHVAALAGGATDAGKGKEETWVSYITAGLKQMLVEDNDEVMEYLGLNL